MNVEMLELGATHYVVNSVRVEAKLSDNGAKIPSLFLTKSKYNFAFQDKY